MTGQRMNRSTGMRGKGRRKPNLVIVFADQMRCMSMGTAGNTQVMTPNLDRLAAGGAMFTNAVSNLAICAPHRAMMLTGRYPLGNTVFTNNIQLPTDIPSLGKMLKGQGYHTGYIGKWHLKGEPAKEGFVPPGAMRHGFEYWAVHNCTHRYYDSTYYLDSPEPVLMEGWQPDGQTDLLIDYLKRRLPSREGKNDPFALVMSWGPPHTPFIAPPEYKTLYPAEKVELRPNVKLEFPPNLDFRYAGPYSEPEMILKDITSTYYAAVTNLDYNMGRIMKILKETGLERDTILVFTSDHGEMLGSHGHFHKGQPWEESIRVPFIVSFPGTVREGLRSDAPFGTPDILPTLLGLMGLQATSGTEGEDLSGILRGEDCAAPGSSLLMSICTATTWNGIWGPGKGRGMPSGFWRPYRGVRTRNYTCVRDIKGPWLLYDNVKDPYQTDNLVAAKGPGAVPPELDRELDRWLERTRDSFRESSCYERLVDLKTGLVTDREGLSG